MLMVLVSGERVFLYVLLCLPPVSRVFLLFLRSVSRVSGVCSTCVWRSVTGVSGLCSDVPVF